MSVPGQVALQPDGRNVNSENLLLSKVGGAGHWLLSTLTYNTGIFLFLEYLLDKGSPHMFVALGPGFCSLSQGSNKVEFREIVSKAHIET